MTVTKINVKQQSNKNMSLTPHEKEVLADKIEKYGTYAILTVLLLTFLFFR